MKTLAVAASLLLLSAARASATITVTVLDQDGHGVPNASVCACAPGEIEHDTARIAATDGSGNPAVFADADLLNGVTYHLLVGVQGFLPTFQAQLADAGHPAIYFTGGARVATVHLSSAAGLGEIDVAFSNIHSSWAVTGKLRLAANPSVVVSEGISLADGAGSGTLRFQNVPDLAAGEVVATLDGLTAQAFKEISVPVEKALDSGSTPLSTAADGGPLSGDFAYTVIKEQIPNDARRYGALGRVLDQYGHAAEAVLSVQSCSDSRTVAARQSDGGTFQLFDLQPHSTYYVQVVSGGGTPVGAVHGGITTVYGSAASSVTLCGAAAPAPDANGFVYEGNFLYKTVQLPDYDSFADPPSFKVVVADGLGNRIPEGWVTLTPDTATWNPYGYPDQHGVNHPGFRSYTSPIKWSYELSRYISRYSAAFSGVPSGHYIVRAYTPYSTVQGVSFNAGTTTAPGEPASWAVTVDTGMAAHLGSKYGPIISRPDNNWVACADQFNCSFAAYEPVDLPQLQIPDRSILTVVVSSPSAAGRVTGTIKFPGGGYLTSDLYVTLRPADGSDGGAVADITNPVGQQFKFGSVPYSIAVATGQSYVIELRTMSWGAVGGGANGRVVDLRASTAAVVNFDLASGGLLKGFVRTPLGPGLPSDPDTGAPLSRVRVEASGPATKGTGFVWSDGSYEIDSLVSGRYDLRVVGDGDFPFAAPLEPVRKIVFAGGSVNFADVPAVRAAALRPVLSTASLPAFAVNADPACTAADCRPEAWVARSLPAGSRLSADVLRQFMGIGSSDAGAFGVALTTGAALSRGCAYSPVPERGWCYGAVAAPSAYDVYALRSGSFDQRGAGGIRPYFSVLGATKTVLADAASEAGSAVDATGFAGQSRVDDFPGGAPTQGGVPECFFSSGGPSCDGGNVTTDCSSGVCTCYAPCVLKAVQDVEIPPRPGASPAQAALTGSVSGSSILRKQDFDEFGGSFINFLQHVPLVTLYDSSGVVAGGGAVTPDPSCVAASADGLQSAVSGGDWTGFVALTAAAVACSGGAWKFDIRGLQPGATYTLAMTGPNYPPFQTSVVLGADGSTTTVPAVDLDATVGAGAVLSFQLRKPGGAAIGNADVRLRSQSYGPRLFVTGADGKINSLAGGVRGLPAGAYTLEASSAGYAQGAMNFTISTAAASAGAVYGAALTLLPGNSSVLARVYAPTFDSPVSPQVGVDVYAYDDTQNGLHGSEPNFALPLYKLKTDQYGQANFLGLVKGDAYKIFVRAPRYVVASMTQVAGAPGTADFILAQKPFDLDVFSRLAGDRFEFALRNADDLQTATGWVSPAPFNLSVSTPVSFQTLPGGRYGTAFPAASLTPGSPYVLRVEARSWGRGTAVKDVAFQLEQDGNAAQQIDTALLGDDSTDASGQQDNQVVFDPSGGNGSMITFAAGGLIPVSTDAIPACTFSETDPGASSSATVVGSTEAFASGVYDVSLSSVNFTERGFDLTFAYNPTKTDPNDLDVYIYVSTSLASDIGVAGARAAALTTCSKTRWCSAKSLGLTTVLDPLGSTLTIKKIKSLTGVLSSRGSRLQAVFDGKSYRPNTLAGGWRGERASFAVMKPSRVSVSRPALAAAALGVSSAAWTWPADANATAYSFQPSTGGAPIVLPAGSSSLTLTALSTNTFYAGRVATVSGTEGGLASASTGAFTLAAAPEAFAPAEVDFSSMTVQWSTHTNPAGTRYVLTRTGLAAPLTVTTGAVRMAGLVPNTSYTLTLRALNGDGKATETLVFSTTTLPLKPGTVSGLAAVSVDTGTIAWSWKPVLGAAGAFGYRVWPQEGGPSVLVATTAYAASGLTPNAARSIKVQAENSTGDGPLTAAVTGYSLAAAPASLAFASVNVTTLTVTWDAQGNAPGTKYQLSRWKPGGSTITITVAPADPSVNVSTLTGLTANTVYRINVRALNGKALPTAFAVEIGTRTDAARPGAIAAFRAGGTDTAAVTFAWTAQNSGATQSDSFLFSPSTGGVFETFTNSYVLYAPAPNTPVSGRVRGRNASGPGPLSAAVTGYSLAAAPTGLSASAVDVTSVTVTWNVNGNPDGTVYLLSRWVAGGSTTTAILSKTAAQIAAGIPLSGLTANTTYQINVRAQNAQQAATAFDPAVEITVKTRHSASVAALTAARPVRGWPYAGRAVRLGAAGPAAFRAGAAKTVALKTGVSLSSNGTILFASVPAPAGGEAKLTVFTKSGARVKEILLGELKGGFDYYFEWDGTFDDGATAPPGPYYAILSFSGSKQNAILKLAVAAPVKKLSR